MNEEHHSTEQDLIQNRILKLERIRARGDDPFKYSYDRSCTIHEARAAFEEAEKQAENPESIDVQATLAGRMTAFRSHGKSSFADLRDA